jgi:hypothetical protein
MATYLMAETYQVAHYRPPSTLRPDNRHRRYVTYYELFEQMIELYSTKKKGIVSEVKQLYIYIYIYIYI